MGDTPWERAEIESLCHHIIEMVRAFQHIDSADTHAREDFLTNTHTIAATCQLTQSSKDERQRRGLRWWLSAIERRLGGGGGDGVVDEVTAHCLHGRPSLADVYLYAHLADYCGSVLETPYRAYAGPSFGYENMAAVNAAVAEFPHIAAVVDGVHRHPGVAAWLQKREGLKFIW